MGREFSDAGEYGELPQGFQEWQRGLTYTVRPDLLWPIRLKGEVRLNVTVRHVAPRPGTPPSFAELYDRATTVMAGRIGALRCDDMTAVAGSWIVAHAWFVNELGAKSVYSASITSAVSFLPEGTPAPVGEPRPEAAALLVPSGGTPEAFAAKHANDQDARRLDEVYVDFEHAGPARDITVSYGEYVPTCHGLDYAPIVARAEACARFHHRTLGASDRSVTLPFDVLRCEWTCLSTNKTVDPAIATVHVYFRI
jgi:hypothetical protein